MNSNKMLPPYKIKYQNGKFKTKRDLYARKGAPNTNVPFVEIAAGTIIEYAGWVENGEVFKSISKWFFDAKINFFWAGNCEDFGQAQIYIKKYVRQNEDFSEELDRKDEQKFKFHYNPLDKIFITQRFGERPDVYKRWGMAGHNGVDFRTRFEDSLNGKRKVYAVLGGVVTEAITKVKDDYGKYVRLTHEDSSTTLYAHLDSLNVVARQEVKAGYVIGISDNTHLTPAGSTGPHLHFGYRPPDMNWHNGYKGYEDPESFLI